MAPSRIVTIGVYGYGENAFFRALRSEGVDLFCDLRARRGLRGSEYAFANATRLQARLTTLGIVYEHFKDLAPSERARELQRQVDREAGIAKRRRDNLDPAFAKAYSVSLHTESARRALGEIARIATVPALFCVEQLPEACHRSLVAEALSRLTGAPIEHVLP